MKIFKLKGLKFNSLKVIDSYNKLDRNKHDHNLYWKCLCECGKYRYVTSHDLTKNKVRSCGCKDSQKQKGKNNSRWRGYEEISGHFWCMLKQNSKSRNLKFNLTLKYIWDLFIKQQRLCALTNLPIIFTNDSRLPHLTTASIDRIDSSKGYIKNNIQWVHKDINFMKQELSQEEFIKICKLVSEKFS